MSNKRADEMKLPPMVTNNEDPKGTAYTVSCDAASGVSTGICGGPRTHRADSADASSRPADTARATSSRCVLWMAAWLSVPATPKPLWSFPVQLGCPGVGRHCRGRS